MKAVTQDRYGSADVLKVTEVPRPVPAEGEVLVRVHAAAVNAYDWHFLHGDPRIARLSMGLRGPKEQIRGRDFAGRVEAVGSAVKGLRLVRLQCYEGVDESRALYEWNHAKQLLRISAGRDESWDETRTDIFSEEFLLTRPLLTAIRGDDPKVLLIDETDKADVEVEGLLLEVLSDFQVTVPELGTITATRRPFVVLTSNASRELSEALRRRCLFLHIGFPDEELEQRIVRLKVPGLDEALASSVVRVVGALRAMDLRKVPSVAETIDWARTLLALGADTLDETVVHDSLGVLLKHQDDVLKAAAKLDLDAV